MPCETHCRQRSIDRIITTAHSKCLVSDIVCTIPCNPVGVVSINFQENSVTVLLLCKVFLRKYVFYIRHSTYLLFSWHECVCVCV